MKTLSRPALAIVAAVVILSASGAFAARSLRDLKDVNEGLAVIAAGDLIQKNCPTISPRLVRAFFFAKELEAKAKAAGFDDDQIEAYVEDKAEKARVVGIARGYLISVGLDPARPETWCEVGLYEIERNSQIGVLLKAK